MKIILLLNYDIHSATALNLLCDSLKKHQITIFASQKVGNLDNTSPLLSQIKKVENSGVDELYLKATTVLGCKVNFVKNINSEESLAEILDLKPDLIISIRFGQILKDKVIKLSKFGVINLHSGILPDYRGIMATFWAILHGEKEIGTTLHYINDAQIDRGNIIAFTKQAVNFEVSLVKNINDLYVDGCHNIIEFIEKIEHDLEVKTIEQKTLGSGNYYSYPTTKDLENCAKIINLF